MSKFRRFVNDLRGIHPKRVDNKRSESYKFDHNGHKVSVYYLQDKPEDPHSYASHFQVDGEFGKNERKMKSSDGIAILAKIHSHVKHFIDTKKPSELRFTANNPAKHEIYGKVASMIAKKHGGTVNSNSKTHTINFPKKPSILSKYLAR